MFSVAVSVDEGLAQHVCDGEPALSAHPEKSWSFCVSAAISSFIVHGFHKAGCNGKPMT